MAKITLEQWRMFRLVVEHGGFNQASRQIHKSQSSIHAAVNKIEAILEVKLFTVEAKKMVITEAGEVLLRRANSLLDEADKLEAVGHVLSEGVETQLKIAVDEIFPQQLLYNVFEATSAKFPMLNIELTESILNGASELLEHYKVDLAITPKLPKNGHHENLCEIDFIAVAHPEHALHQLNRAITRDDLKHSRQIVIRDSAAIKRQSQGWLGAEERWTVSNMQTSINMICNGLGYAWLPVSAIKTQLDSGLLKQLPATQWGNRTVELFLAFNDPDALGPAAKTFIEELRCQSKCVCDLNTLS
jgi:DNA-binding transcriptional LysR family regulator